MARSIGQLFGAVSFVAVLFCFFSLLLAGGQVHAAFAPMRFIKSNTITSGVGLNEIQGRLYSVGTDKAFIHRARSQGVVSRPYNGRYKGGETILPLFPVHFPIAILSFERER